MTAARPNRARDLWRLLEPIHAVTYFSPEPLAALRDAGYRGFWMGYFAGRSAPLGEASAELVEALFYNFDAEHIARALPDAWRFAGPDAALRAREAGSVAALRRHLQGVSSPVVARAADLAAQAAAAAPVAGRPLFAANRALPEPVDPLARLWHAATLLREHRGDGHVAALVSAQVTGREAHVLHGLATGTPAATYRISRGLDDATWSTVLSGFLERGFVDDSGGLTQAGRDVKQTLEDLTDELAWPAYAELGAGDLDELAVALRPITVAVVSAGEIPIRSPMGLDLTQFAQSG